MRMRLAAVAVLLLGMGTVTAQTKDEKSLSRVEVEKRAALSAYEATVVGTDLFNRAKDYEGCYRVYQGTLMALYPMLDHRPTLAASIRDRLDEAKRMKAGEAAHLLRQSLEDVQDLNRTKRTLWVRLGGELAVRAVVNDFLRAIATDPKVNVTRDGKYPLDAKGAARLSQLLVEQISEATGGPLKYTGRNMKTTHAGMKITESEFDAAAVHFVDVLVKAKVPDAEREELRDIIASMKADIVEVRDAKPKDGKDDGKKTLWDRLGGEDRVRVVVREFISSAAFDPKVNFTRNGKYKVDTQKLEQQLVEQISSATGGPLKYTGRDMKTAHAGMKITKDEFAAMEKHFIAALGKYRVPLREVEELSQIVRSTMKDIVEDK